MPYPGELEAYPLLPDLPSDELIDQAAQEGMALMTSLFREDARLPEVVRLARESWNDSDGQFSVVSVGCSIGVEAASILSLIDNETPELGPVKFTGVDLYDELIAAARDGRYRLAVPAGVDEEAIDRLEGLRAYGLDVWPNPDDTEELILDANPLFDRHDVTFRRANMAFDPDPDVVPLANLIVCNNVLIHRTPDGAEEIVNGMVGRLAIGGVMSFGSNTALGTTASWNREMVGILADWHISPVLHDVVHNAPFAFRREA